MSEKHIHIVCLDVPFPANYGGAIDMYYRIKSMHNNGWKINLHVFDYGRGKQQNLNNLCHKIYYYSRNKSLKSFFSHRPYIVQSRINKNLEMNLLKDNHPIWLEGIHCTGILENMSFKNRTIAVRLHNIEQDYYQALAEQSKGWRKIFFKTEAYKLKCYEQILKKATGLFAIQNKDVQHFQQINPETFLLPAAFPIVEMQDYDLKDYHLFHGNLSVAENEEAAIWLTENVFTKLKNQHFIIAGKEPTERLKQYIKSQNNIEIIENPSDSELNRLINEAKNHVLYTEQATGVKLKLIHVLQSKGNIIVNDLMVQGTEFSSLCQIANKPEEFIAAINNETSHHKTSLEERKNYLLSIQPDKTISETINPFLSRYL